MGHAFSGGEYKAVNISANRFCYSETEYPRVNKVEAKTLAIQTVW
jgi:hypothetical protein